MKNEGMQTEANEFGLVEAVNFLKENRKSILLGGMVGLSLAIAYVVLTPKKYEARWQVQMAEFDDKNSNSTSHSIEEPAAILQRLRTPTAYPLEVHQSCGMPENGEFGDYLGGALKIAVVKNVDNAVEMTFTAASTEQAKKCAEAIVEMIVVQHRGQIERRLAGRQAQEAEYRKALLEEQQQLEKIKKSELGNFGYLARIDKLSWLRTRIDTLHEEALLSQMHPARLVSPIYAPSKPVAPKVKLVLLMGLTLGLLLGVLYSIGRLLWGRAD